MEVVATAKWVRTTARKARLVSAMVTGLPVAEALVVLQFSPRSAAADIASAAERIPTAILVFIVIMTPIVTLARLRGGATGPCRDAIVALDGRGTFSGAGRKK